MTDVVNELVDELGTGVVATGASLAERATSYRDSSPTQAKAMLRPSTTDEVSRAMQICDECNQPVVVQGGLTGVVQGAVSSGDDIIVSLEKMNRIESVDEVGGVAVVQAGAVLQTVQEELAVKGMLFPLDFGHIADGNLHIFVTPHEDGVNHKRCDEIVYGCLDGLSVSISSEHGIGIEKKAWLGKSRSEDEIRLMRKLKALLDPKNLLNSGNVLG